MINIIKIFALWSHTINSYKMFWIHWVLTTKGLLIGINCTMVFPCFYGINFDMHTMFLSVFFCIYCGFVIHTIITVLFLLFLIDRGITVEWVLLVTDEMRILKNRREEVNVNGYSHWVSELNFWLIDEVNKAQNLFFLALLPITEGWGMKVICREGGAKMIYTCFNTKLEGKSSAWSLHFNFCQHWNSIVMNKWW